MSNFLKNRNAVIIVAVVVFVFLLAFVPIMINVLSKDDAVSDTPDTGEVLSGTYVSDVGVGSSKYVFDGKKVTNTYVVNGETTTIEYNYVIAVENGEKVIKLTTVNDDGVEETKTHTFEKGSWNDTPCIFINDAMYFLSK